MGRINKDMRRLLRNQINSAQRNVLLAAAVLTAAIWAYALAPTDSRLTLTVLDVGEGLCAVLRTPTGKTVVVDCGTSSWRDDRAVGSKLAGLYLQSIGANVIDLAVLTHPHWDHISGYPSLLKMIPAKMVLELGGTEDCPEYDDFSSAVRMCSAQRYLARRGQVLSTQDGVRIYVLNPDLSRTYEDLNNRSIVLRVVYKRKAFLLSGDIEEPAQRYILESGANVRSQVLLVGHHGSQASCSREWLSAVKPVAAIISCGRRNQHGHPSPIVIKRLQDMGVRVYRTDTDGAIAISTDGKRLFVRTFKK